MSRSGDVNVGVLRVGEVGIYKVNAAGELERVQPDDNSSPIVCNQITIPYADCNKRPFCCPVCSGTGLVSRPPDVAGDQKEWSSSSTAAYPCKACEGKGIVWG